MPAACRRNIHVRVWRVRVRVDEAHPADLIFGNDRVPLNPFARGVRGREGEKKRSGRLHRDRKLKVMSRLASHARALLLYLVA